MNSNPSNNPPSRNGRKPRLKLLADDLQLAQVDPVARRQASCVLEVLAGLRTPEQAAESLEVSLPTYFNIETRALRGLVHGCTPTPPGRQMALGKKLREAEAQVGQLQQQLRRYQALLRTAQRSVGLAPPSPADAKSASKRKRRKPAVRALRAIKALQDPPDASQPVAPAEVASAT